MQPSQQRREEEKQRRHEEILDAAEQVFCERGFDAATMDDVALRARVSRALVYVYFRDKRALHLAICRRALNQLRRLFQEAVQRHERGRDQLLAVGRAYMEFARSYPAYFQALSRFEATEAGAPDDEDPAHSETMAAGRCVHEVTVAAIEQGMRDGSLRADIENPMQIAMTMWGFTHGVLQIAQHKGSVIQNGGVTTTAFVDDALALAVRSVEP
ncbi:TetR/AcrR family transcriptional regulator [Algiphilus sp.]|uniref:TetR/AcrR family transcriptional regulator n=1 Tax=Algiphilus sp. TaxID=1872431 RepID=UPI001CA78554|nr:TetR/AcrR family transcriptional regulator [Algiphilus acroporae]MCR9091365.1 TetR/AcrR family transcriptional regulator [Pseudomonadota bacterium]